MDEREFQRLLVLFPVVRTPDYCQADSESSRQSTSQAARDEDWQDAWNEQEPKKKDVFWDKLRSAAEQKVGSAGADKFCNAFEKIYHKLVHEELSREVMESFVNSS